MYVTFISELPLPMTPLSPQEGASQARKSTKSKDWWRHRLEIRASDLLDVMDFDGIC